MSWALLLVDLQEDFLAQVIEPHRDRLLAGVRAVLGIFRQRALPVLHVRTSVTLEPDTRMPHWRGKGTHLCVAGTPGELAPVQAGATPGEAVLVKPFFSAFSNTDLESRLRAGGIRSLVVAGVHTHACVRQTALDGYSRGFRVVLSEEAIGSYDPLQAAVTVAYLDERDVPSWSLGELLQALDQPAQANANSFPSTGDQAGVPSFVLNDNGIGTLWTHVCPRDGSARFALRPCAPEQIDQAARSSYSWHRSFRRFRVEARVRLLNRFAAGLEARSAELEERLIEDIGKPLSQARGEVAAAVASVRDVAQRLVADCASDSPRWRRCPLGVVALITPYNNPLMIPVGKIAPALGFGNCVLWKPSPYGAAIARIVMECWQDLRDVSIDALKILHGDAQTARALMEHGAVDAVTLSGGIAAGHLAQSICARRNLPFQAELGGNNAAILWQPADRELAAAMVVEGAFGFAGQRCTANRRVVVPREEQEEWVELLTKAMGRLAFGDPRRPETSVGPLISERQKARVSAVMERAEQAGARRRNHPAPPPPGGCYLAPALFWEVASDSEIVQEETFGPVLVIQPAESFSDAIDICNAVPQGLVAALFSTDRGNRSRFLERARAGILKFDQATSGGQTGVPFGGWKASGVGPPEHGVGNLMFYTRLQSIYGEVD